MKKLVLPLKLLLKSFTKFNMKFKHKTTNLVWDSNDDCIEIRDDDETTDISNQYYFEFAKSISNSI